jgi:hypothetical protein
MIATDEHLSTTDNVVDGGSRGADDAGPSTARFPGAQFVKS